MENIFAYILLFDDDLKIEINNINTLIGIFKEEYPQYIIITKVYKSLNEFEIKNEIKDKLIYVIVSGNDIDNLVNYFKNPSFGHINLIIYTTNKDKFKYKDKYHRQGVYIVASALNMNITLQQLIRPQLSLAKEGRRNSVSQPITKIFKYNTKISKIIVCNYTTQRKKYMIKSFVYEDNKGNEFNICEKLKNEEFNKDILLEEIFRPLFIDYSPEKHFEKFKVEVINQFKKLQLFDINELEVCKTLKELCLKIIHIYAFNENNTFNNKINEAFKSLEKNENTDLIEEMKFIMISILISFNKDYHYDNIENSVYLNTTSIYNERIKNKLLVYSYNPLLADVKSLKNKEIKKKRKDMNTIIEFEIIPNNTDMFFHNVICLTNILTSKNKTIQDRVYIISPLSKFSVQSYTIEDNIIILRLNLSKHNRFSFMHKIFNFTYNITLENLIPYEKEKKIKQKIFKQINYIHNYSLELEAFKLNTSITTTFINFQLGILSFLDKEFNEAINKFNICKEFHDNLSYHFIAEILYYLGKCYFKIEDYDSSIESFENSSTIYIKNNCLVIDIANMYGLIGDYYDKFNKIKALDYFTKQLDVAKQIFREENDYIANIYRRIGNYYYELDSFNNAIEYLKKDLVIRERLGEGLEISICYLNMALVYEYNELNSTALEMCNTSKEYLDSS